MVSATSLCLLAIGLYVTSADLLSSDADYLDTPTSDRRTFKHTKPVKLLSFAKKHKKFGGLVPHIFGKTHYTEIPVIHESPKPLYKIHKFHGVELKPVSDFSFSTPEPIIETHSVEPSSDFLPTFSQSSIFYSGNEKPIFSHSVVSSPAPFYTSFVAPPPKPIFSIVPIAPQPPFSIPIAPIPALPPVSIARPVPIQALPPPPPSFTSIPAAAPPPPPPQSIFSAVPIRFQAPVLPPLPAPSPSPAFSSVPIKIHSPALPPITVPSPAPVLVKIPAPAIPAPSPVPVFSTVSPTPGPIFSSIPISLPPPQFQAIPSPSPSLPTFSALPSIPASPTPEPEFQYPPSGTPIPSYIKDISLGDIEIKDSPLPTIETPKYEEVTPTIVDDSSKKHLDHSFGVIKNDHGFFQKLKGWKADKANEALSHFAHFKPKPFFQNIPYPTTTIPTAQLPIHPTVQFSGPVHSLPLAPAPVFFPSAPFFSSAKYENFPPNNIESSPLVNSYGLPIPHDSYSPPRTSHDRLSSAASEEEPAVVPAPGDQKDQNLENHQPEYLTQNFNVHEHPVYVPEDNQAVKEGSKSAEDTQSEPEDYKKEPTPEASITHNYPNHKEQ